jgi:hypothetical protein
MMRATHRLLSLALVLTAAACGGANSASTGTAAAGRAETQSSRISFEEIQQRGQYSNLYDVVEHLRPRWLRSQGPDTFTGEQGQVQVHMNGNLLGSVDVLRRMSPVGVTSLEWVPPIQAAAQFGLNHSHGAIIVSTKPGPEPSQ